MALALVGLALLDALNTSALLLAVAALLAAPRRPVVTALACVAGAAAAFAVLGVALYLGAAAAEAAVAGGLPAVRRAGLVLLAVLLLVHAVRRARRRPGRVPDLTRWASPAAAAGLGVLGALSDLPTAFPFLLAVERLVSADVTTTTALLALLGYVVVLSLPALVVVRVVAAHREGARSLLEGLLARLGAKDRSVPVVVACVLLAGAALALAAAL
nr:GAP family protein [Kineococcus siccus]